jgi:hypothetical protein
MGTQSIRVSQDGRYASLFDQERSFTVEVSVSMGKGIAYAHVRVENKTNKPITIKPSMFFAVDGGKTKTASMSPFGVMRTIYGDIDKRAWESQISGALSAAMAAAADADARANPPYATRAPTVLYRNYTYGLVMTSPGSGSSRLAPSLYRVEESSAAVKERNELAAARSDASFLGKNALKASEIRPGSAVEGLLYFPEPKVYPLTVRAEIGGERLRFRFKRF